MQQVWTTLGVKVLLHYSSRLIIWISFLVFSLFLKVTRETRRIDISHSDSPRPGGRQRPQGDFVNVENKHTHMYYYIRVSFSCVFPIS
jgi:hypothetical protein